MLLFSGSLYAMALGAPRWLGAVKARAADIGEADAHDTGGCHTSYLQGFITMGNIGGWLEDAPKAFADLQWDSMSTSMPRLRTSTLSPTPAACSELR